MASDGYTHSSLGLSSRSNHWFLLPLPILLGIGLLVRVTVLLLYMSSHNWTGESWEPEIIALNLLQGKGFVIDRYNALYYALYPPLFPFVCFILHLLAGTGAFYQVAYFTYHIGLALGIIWLSYRLALTWFGISTASLVGLMTALEPGLVVYQSYKIDVVTLSTFLLLAGLWLFQTLTRTRRLHTAALLGTVIGLSLLTRLDLLILLGPLGAWLIIERRRIRSLIPPIALALSISILVISPWLIRNYLVLDRFVFISSTGGEWLWLGNNDNSIGTPVALDGQGVFTGAPASLKQSIAEATDEFQVNKLFMDSAVRYITEDPLRYIRLAGAKFWYFWWFTPTYGWKYQQVGDMWKIGYKGLHAAVLFFTLIGTWQIFRKDRHESRQGALYILTVCLLMALLHSLTYVEGRHRLMVEPLLLMLAAHGIWSIYEWLTRRVDMVMSSGSSQPLT